MYHEKSDGTGHDTVQYSFMEKGHVEFHMHRRLALAAGVEA
jgi:hypothetical protein